MDLDFSPYAVGGAAARADSFTRLDPNFATGVHGLTQAAHAAGIPLQITSAYRSPELQAQLYASALERYGSPQAARRWVAPPGRSQHNYGTAVDFALNGSLLRDADSPAAQFIRNNADQYGLSVPMSWEPWQVEPVGSRDGSRPQAAMTTRNATALSPGAALNFRGAPQMAMQPTQPQGLLGQLGIQRRDPTAQGETALPFYQRSRFSNTMGNLAMAFNSLRQNPDENIPRIVTGQRATREQGAANNRTAEWLSSQPGGERFAGLVESIGAAGALQAYQQSQAQPDQTSAMQNYQFLLSQGTPPADALERAFGGGVTINTGDQGSSAGLEALDKQFAETYATLSMSGLTDARSQASTVGAILEKLEAGEQLTGPLIGAQPDFLRALTNPDAQDAIDRVGSVVQRSLREILGGQFAQREGEQLVRRAYNPSLPPEMNAARLRALFAVLDQTAQNKMDMATYYQENNYSLGGYSGNMRIAGVTDIDAAMDAAAPLPTGDTPSPSGATPSPSGGAVIRYDAQGNRIE